MNCRDVREIADSFLCEELLTETNHEILRHLDTCPSCRTEIDARRRLRGALRDAFQPCAGAATVSGVPQTACATSCATYRLQSARSVVSLPPMARACRGRRARGRCRLASS